MGTDEDLYNEIAAALGWPDDMTHEETAATLADMFPNAEDAAEIEEEVLGF